jgi:deoxyadenosine/deoxycytidine kinase
MLLGQTLFRAGSRAFGLNLSPRALSTLSTSTLNPILVSIEGNIGAGKTTLLNSLRQSWPEWIFIDEPVSTWGEIKNTEGESILEVFYRDRKRWSYTFQTCALLTRYQNIELAVNHERMLGKMGNLVFLTERCLDTDYQVFTKVFDVYVYVYVY